MIEELLGKKKTKDLGIVYCMFCKQKKPITKSNKIGVIQICDECLIRLGELIKFHIG